MLVAGIVLLGGFRVGLDVVEGKVGDVGYASAIGATRIQEGQPLYADSGKDDEHMDTYGPVNYLAYDPFVRVWKPSQQEIQAPDDYELPAARVAALVFDAFTVLGLFLLGMRLRRGREGRLLGLALAYGWVSFPYTLFPLMSNSNDTLIPMLLVYALLALSSPPARGMLVALASAAKFAPLALAPLFATGRGEARTRSWVSFTMTFLLVGLLAVVPFIPVEGGWHVFWDQTMGFQFGRQSPFSIWGQNPGLDPLLAVVKLAVVALGVLVAFVPRRRDALQVAALGAAVLLATQLTAIHWFYLYIVWFAPFLLVALFGEYSTARGRARRSPCPQRSRCPVIALEHERPSWSAHARTARPLRSARWRADLDDRVSALRRRAGRDSFPDGRVRLRGAPGRAQRRRHDRARGADVRQRHGDARARPGAMTTSGCAARRSWAARTKACTSSRTIPTRCTTARNGPAPRSRANRATRTDGSRDFTALDPEGNIWSFGTYDPFAPQY